MRLFAYLLAFLGFAFTAQAQQIVLPLDISTVTTGGTAVTAISANHRTAGGKIQNPVTATIDLCINEIDTASGTTSAGNTTCIPPGYLYRVSPSSNAVSVISADSAHPFSGEALITPPPTTTTMYLVGNGAAAITPRSTATWTVQVWGGGGGGNDSTGAGGKGGGWATKTFSATSGTPVSFSLGNPGVSTHVTPGIGGDTWFSSSGFLIAPGGGSATAAIGTSSFAGGNGGTFTTQALPGGGGAAGPAGNGNVGASPVNTSCAGLSGASAAGAGGGGNGGGTAGLACDSFLQGGNGGNGFAGVGGVGGATGVGANGGLGAGGGGGFGNQTSSFAGGSGGDDYDNGGGGAGAPGAFPPSGGHTNGSNGGTPGGGGTDCFNNAGGGCTIGNGGWSVIKITYLSSDADQIYELGTIPMPVDIPVSWTNGYTTTTPGGGVTAVLTKNTVTATQVGYLILLGVGQ